jgi:hypothetical protein
LDTVIDLGSELLVDESRICDPYVRLLMAAVGQKLALGSPWIAMDKRAAVLCCLPSRNPLPGTRRARRSHANQWRRHA